MLNRTNKDLPQWIAPVCILLGIFILFVAGHSHAALLQNLKRPELSMSDTTESADPNRVYKDKGWKGYGDWLGN